jgi:hypothetical protein
MREVYLNKPGAQIEDKGWGVIIRYTTPNGPAAVIFKGRQSKPVWGPYLGVGGSLEQSIQQFVKFRDDEWAQAQADKATDHGLVVGSILSSSWGYDQTNVDFYEVVAVTGKQVIIREIAAKQVGRDSVVPVIGKFVGAPMRKAPSIYRGKPWVKINSYASAKLWDGKPAYETPSEEGH